MIHFVIYGAGEKYGLVKLTRHGETVDRQGLSL